MGRLKNKKAGVRENFSHIPAILLAHGFTPHADRNRTP